MLWSTAVHIPCTSVHLHSPGNRQTGYARYIKQHMHSNHHLGRNWLSENMSCSKFVNLWWRLKIVKTWNETHECCALIGSKYINRKQKKWNGPPYIFRPQHFVLYITRSWLQVSSPPSWSQTTPGTWWCRRHSSGWQKINGILK